MRSPEWVVLDLGETLVDETRQWSDWAEYLGVPVLAFFGCLGAVIAERRPHTDVFEYFRPGFDLAAETSRKQAQGLVWCPTRADLYDDALPTLARLRQSGHKTAVMANQPSTVEPFLETLPIDAWATSEGWGVAKPDPEFFARVALELAASPEEVAYVGDRIDNDVLPAKAAGMTAIHVCRGPWGFIQADWPEAARADFRLRELAELPESLARRGG